MFDYAAAMERLVEDILTRSDVFQHIEMPALLIGCIRARNCQSTGLYARTVPLRFENGSHTTRRGSATYRVPKVIHEGNEILYIVSFCLPRFQDLSFEDEITTIFHELYHIAPHFNGDIRRFEGKNYVHGSGKKYDRQMQELSRKYLHEHPQQEIFAFLRPSYEELSCAHGGVRMTIYQTPHPELVEPVTLPATAKKKRKRTGKRR